MFFIFRTIIAPILLIGLEYYFFKKIKRTISIVFPDLSKNILNKTIIFIIVLLNIYPVYSIGSILFSTLTGSLLSPIPLTLASDYLLIYPFWTFILIMVQCFFFFIIYETGKFAALKMKYNSVIIKSIEAKLVLVTVIFFIFYVPGRIIYDYQVVNIREVEYQKKGLSKDLIGLRIVFISDMQADHYTNEKRLNNFISKVNQANPDLVLIAGDFITNSPDYINIAAEYSGKINSVYGVFSCIGDHDNWAYRSDNTRSLKEITDALQQNNVKMIDDSNLKLNVKNSNIGITFITNTYVRKAEAKIIDKLAVGSVNNDLRIFLTHQPRQYLVEKAKKYNYDLMLAGHTHGGQITLLFPFFLITPTLFETQYVKGDFFFDDMLLIVTRGLGMSILPVRYNASPEVVVITLKA